MPSYRRRSEPLLLDHSVKHGWGYRLRQRLPKWRWRIPVPRPTRQQLRLAAGAAILAVVSAVTLIAWKLYTERSARLIPGEVLLGRNAPLGGIRLFPDDNPWNTPVDDRPVHPKSDIWLETIGTHRALHPDFGTNRLGNRLYGIPYVVVTRDDNLGQTPEFSYAEQSDDGLYPIPDNPPIEAGGDRHVLIVDRDEWRLYELYRVTGSPLVWRAGSGAIFDLGSNASRPRNWTSADAAGLPILPGLVRADEVYDLGEIRHALRFTLPRTHNSFLYPARHQASHLGDSRFPPMGMRMRLKASVDLSDFPEGARVIAEALKRYGMMLADNGGAMYLTGTADRRWKRRDTEALKRLRVGDFEVVVPPSPPASDTTVLREIEAGLPGFSEQ
ncbi:MAG TPA: hypothetical protein PLL69_03360 [Gemmatimonadales bacterium]|nr:hypothetical protein [Gemmatimonadales bacterium]